MTITVTGASGFLGTALIRHLLAGGHSLRVLGRSRRGLPAVVSFSPWDALSEEPPAATLHGANAVIHLAGEPVAQRWSPEAKRRIRESRSGGTRRLVEVLSRSRVRPETLISASAVGFYGSRGNEILTESSAPGAGFLSEVCQEWEAAARRAADFGVRVVVLRFGVVLGPGGALQKMMLPFRLGLGGPLGSGRQWMPWVHLDDVVGLIQFALSRPDLHGAFNATAPNPVQNADFARSLGRALKRPAVLPVPSAALRLLYGEMAEILLASQRALPERALAAGYHHRYENLDAALREVLTRF